MTEGPRPLRKHPHWEVEIYATKKRGSGGARPRPRVVRSAPVHRAQVWAECVFAARKALNLKGFVAINGKLAEGKALYAKAKALYSARQ